MCVPLTTWLLLFLVDSDKRLNVTLPGFLMLWDSRYSAKCSARHAPPFSASLYFSCTIGLAGWLFISWLFPQNPPNDCIYMHTCNQETAGFWFFWVIFQNLIGGFPLLIHYINPYSSLLFLTHQLRVRHMIRSVTRWGTLMLCWQRVESISMRPELCLLSCSVLS